MAREAIYLDHNASAPLLPAAREAYMGALGLVGNPSSVHAHGRALRDLMEAARGQVARASGAERRQVVFTGSATEAITQALVGAIRPLGIGRIVLSAGDHAAVSKAAELSGLPVTVVGLGADGVINVDEIATALQAANAAGERVLVAVHAVNNETGVVQPVEAIEALVGPTPHYLFVDTVQAFGKLDLDFAARAADMMSLSGHKIGGPAGIGALLVKGHCDEVRLIPGGGQEQGRRGGTENAAAIAAFGAAAEAFPQAYRAAGVDALVADLEAGLRSMAPDLVVFGDNAPRLGNVSNFAVPGVGNAVAMMGLDLMGLSVSSGSACSSGKVGASHVLAAMGVDPHLSASALRISLGWSSTAADIAAFLDGFSSILARHRARRGRAA